MVQKKEKEKREKFKVCPNIRGLAQVMDGEKNLCLAQVMDGEKNFRDLNRVNDINLRKQQNHRKGYTDQ